MDNHILFVFEGEKTEVTIFNSLKKYYLNESDNTILCGVFCSEIYTLYHTMHNDPDLDLFSIIKEKKQNEDLLSNISRDKISEIFLFFDYDGHAPTASDEKLKKMLEYFDEETENGKLYISYPMVEALKHLKSNTPFENIIVKGKEKINYKNIVHQSCDVHFRNIAELNHLHWKTMISEHCKKLNFLMTNLFQLPVSLTSQLSVLDMQIMKHIDASGSVAVLSAFPVFIADYYGYSELPKLVEIHCS